MATQFNHIHHLWPHSGAVLFQGAYSAALHSAEQMLCESTPRSRALLDSNAHPDFRCIQPEEGSQGIKIDQIRDLNQWAVGKPQISNRQIAIIYPAHAMNVQASNALLKTLEEPTIDTLLILVSDRPSLLLPTLRSRCRKLRLPDRDPEDLSSMLKENIKKDLQALQHNQTDPLEIAQNWIKQDPKQILHGLWVILYEDLKHKALNDPDLNAMPKSIQWWSFMDYVMESKRVLEEPNQANVQLLLETILIRYSEVV